MSSLRERSKRATILLVEDDPGDQELTRRALQQDVIRTDLRVVCDGKEALDYLRREGEFRDPADSPKPDLILLDLNMPRIDGRQVLERVREDPRISRIPVVALTTSDEEDDVVRSYALGCKSYIKKPVEVETFIATIRELQHYWFELVTLPPDSPHRR